MKSLGFYLASALLFTGTLWGGLQFGHSASQFGNDQALKGAAKQLDGGLAERLGPWRLVSQQPMEKEVLEMLQCPAHINRVYVNEITGDMVSIFVIVGPPGPIAVHTPEVCYSSRDFTISEKRRTVTIVDRAEREHKLWQVELRSNDGSRPSQQVLYGWGTGKNWSAISEPRYTFAGQPYLYKIQLAGPPKNTANGVDACGDFLKLFLADLNSHLLPSD